MDEARALAAGQLTPAIRILLAGGVLLLAILALGAGLLWLRRRFRRDTESALGREPGFSLEQIEDMRRAGTITGAEFRRIRGMILGLSEAGREEEALSRSPGGHDDEEPEAGDGDVRDEEKE